MRVLQAWVFVLTLACGITIAQWDRHGGRRKDSMPSPRFDDFPSGLPYHPGWYGPPSGGAHPGGTPITLTADLVYAIPFRVHQTHGFTAIGTIVDSTVAGDMVFGLYTAGPTGVLPGLLVAEGDAAVTMTAGAASTTMAKQLTPGWYYFAVCAELDVDITQCITPYITGGFAASGAGAFSWTYLSIAHTYDGTLPADADWSVASTLGTTGPASFMPYITILAE